MASSAASKEVKVVEVDLGDRTYPIYIGSGLNWGETLKKHIPGNSVLVVTNDTIAPLYLDSLRFAQDCPSTLAQHNWTDAFFLFILDHVDNRVYVYVFPFARYRIVKALSDDGKIRVETVVLPDGEKYKTLEILNMVRNEAPCCHMVIGEKRMDDALLLAEVLQAHFRNKPQTSRASLRVHGTIGDVRLQVYDKALEARLDRQTTFVALGGGVIGDMTGYAAASYQRGVHFVQGGREHMLDVGANHRGEESIFLMWEPICLAHKPPSLLCVLPSPPVTGLQNE
eukprot:5380206-Pyramimonas_sp.AAC.1